MRKIRKLLSDARWRLKPVRWAGRMTRRIARMGRWRNVAMPPSLSSAPSDMDRRLERHGYLKLPFKLLPPEIDLGSLAGIASGTSFVDISDRFPEAFAEVFGQVVNHPEIASLVMRYFGGDPWLWNAALNYSDPSRELTDSQLWHFDYGDVRQLHAMVYFSDVTDQSGPFTFLDGELSDRVARHPFIIERLTDADLARTYGIRASEQATRLCGQRGEIFLSDPGRLLHQGARCETPRLVMFISFTTPTPMSGGGGSVMSKRKRQALARAHGADCAAGSLPVAVMA